MIRSFDAVAVSDLFERTDGQVTTGVKELDHVGHEDSGQLDIGVWDHSVGESTDVEVDEVFVVISGRGSVTCDQGGKIELTPGTVGVLPAGAKTTWTVTEPLRKVWVTLG